MKDMSYNAVMGRRAEIIKSAVGMDYSRFESGSIAFDYEGMMKATGLDINEVRRIQESFAIGHTPLIELKNITALARKMAPKGKGARIFIKDEACNPSGSFKARRAATSIYTAREMGYKGAIAATSGNYGAAVASICAMAGLKCIIVQECYDSKYIGQPEIIEKARKCEAFGAEVVQLSVGPELFYETLRMLEDTGYFNASLYTPYGIIGVETLGYEIAEQFRARFGKDPDAVVCTNAGGGNLTGTARGLRKAGCSAKVIAASVNLSGLHMASDTQFNKKSFTTGHTGFGVPFSTWPDRSDVPRSAARPLRYMDRYVTVAQEMDEDQCIVVQETEYTGAGKHVNPQLAFARKNGIDIHFGDPAEEVPGKSIILPAHPSLIKARDFNIEHMRHSLIKNAVASVDHAPTEEDIRFLAEEVQRDEAYVKAVLAGLKK